MDGRSEAFDLDAVLLRKGMSRLFQVVGGWPSSVAPGIEGRDGERLIGHHLVELPEPGPYLFRFEAAVDFQVRLELRNCEHSGMVSNYYAVESVYGEAGVPKELLLFDLPSGVITELGLDLGELVAQVAARASHEGFHTPRRELRLSLE